MGLNLATAAAGLGLCVSLLLGSPTSAQMGPMAAAPTAIPFKIGTLPAWSLHDGQFAAPNNGTTFGVGEPAPAVADVLKKAGAPTDRIILSVNVLLVKTPGHVMLFDTGLGPGLHGGLMASLALTGVKPTDVTDILITHSHGDHIGGLLTSDRHLAFPNAAIRMSSAEWAWMKTKVPTVATAVEPKVKTFEPGGAVLPGVSTVALTGHTPGHVGYAIRSGGARLFDMGDTAHSSIVSLAKPDWKMQFDNDQDSGKAMRRSELTALATANASVFAPHFPYPGIGRIVATGGAFAWKPEALKEPAATVK